MLRVENREIITLDTRFYRIGSFRDQPIADSKITDINMRHFIKSRTVELFNVVTIFRIRQ